MATPRTVLFLGTSSISFRGDGASTVELLRTSLEELAPGPWQVESADLLAVRRSSGEEAAQLLREHNPDVAILGLNAQPVVYESVLVKVRRKWPWALGPARTIDVILRRLARSRGADDTSTRSLLYRLPQALGLALLGGETAVSLEHAIGNTSRCIEALARQESAPLVVRLPVGGAKATPARRRRYETRLRTYKSAITETCGRHLVRCVDVAARLADSGLSAGHGSDAVHLDLRSRQFEAALLATEVLALAHAESLN